MKSESKKIQYPENLYLRGLIATSGKTITELANSIGINRQDVSKTINGHKKGVNIVPALRKELGLSETPEKASAIFDMIILEKKGVVAFIIKTNEGIILESCPNDPTALFKIEERLKALNVTEVLTDFDITFPQASNITTVKFTPSRSVKQHIEMELIKYIKTLK